jgi:hypothetical protein
MNFITMALALMLVVGAIVGFFVVAGSQSEDSYVDTFGNTTNAVTNQTQDAVLAARPSIAGLAGGAALLLSILLIYVAVKGAGFAGPVPRSHR